MLWSILSESSPVDAQLRVEDSPSVIAAGPADMLTVGRLFTVTVTLSLTAPNAFSAIRV